MTRREDLLVVLLAVVAMGSPDRGNIVKRSIIKLALSGLVVAVATMVLLAVAEVALRMLFPDKDVRPSPRELAFVFDPETLVTLRPGVEKTYAFEVEGDQPVVWRSNSQGFRGPELRPDPDLRVVVYGDSNVQARFSPLEETYARRLERYLGEATGRDVEVVNAGVVGFGPDQSLLRLTREISRLRPDLVVLHVFAENDFGDLIRNRLFELDDAGRLIRTGHTATVDSELTTTLGDRLASLLLVRSARKIGQGLRRRLRSSAEPELLDWCRRTIPAEYAVYAAGRPREFSHFADHYDLDVATEPTSESARTKTRLMAEVLAEAHALTSEENVPLLVVVQPSVVDLTTNHLFSHRDLEGAPDYRPENLTSLVREACEERGIPCLDLYEAFRSHGPESLYFHGGNNHWNGEGQDVAARATAGHIQERLWPR